MEEKNGISGIHRRQDFARARIEEGSIQGAETMCYYREKATIEVKYALAYTGARRRSGANVQTLFEDARAAAVHWAGVSDGKDPRGSH